jgi:hypothetical protein
VIRLVVREAMLLLGVGLTAGVLLALWASLMILFRWALRSSTACWTPRNIPIGIQPENQTLLVGNVEDGRINALVALRNTFRVGRVSPHGRLRKRCKRLTAMQIS